jgi:radical SAM superfamily enzyme YgiQ (UPF0313 family)
MADAVDIAIVDEAVRRFNPETVGQNDVVCISTLTNNVIRAYEVAKLAKARGAHVVMGGPHVTLLPHEALEFGADAVVRGDCDTIFGRVLEDVFLGRVAAGGIYQTVDGKPFRARGEEMAKPRLDLVDTRSYFATGLRTINGCRENCSFCTVPAISGREARYRPAAAVAEEVRELYDAGIRFVIWGADNLVQVPMSLIESTRDPAQRKALEAEREEALEFFRDFAKLSGDKRVWGFAQLTLRLHDDKEVLRAIRHDAAICAALFGIESIDPVGLRSIAKQWNGTAAEIAQKVANIQKEGISVLGSMIVGLPTDTPETIAATRRFAVESGMDVAQFPLYELLPGSADYAKAERDLAEREKPSTSPFPIAASQGARTPRAKLLRRRWWLEPEGSPPHLEHPHMSIDALRAEVRKSWRHFYRFDRLVWNGIHHRWPPLRTFVYAVACTGFSAFYSGPVGISVDSARVGKTPFFLRKLMGAGAWLMGKIPPPPPAPGYAHEVGRAESWPSPRPVRVSNPLRENHPSAAHLPRS